jgi:hypothetical protein
MLISSPYCFNRSSPKLKLRAFLSLEVRGAFRDHIHVVIVRRQGIANLWAQREDKKQEERND